MIISCVQCHKKFEIDSNLIPKDGRYLECGACNHKWFYKQDIEDKTEELNDRNLNEKLSSEILDVTLPVSSPSGSIHPITQVIEEVVTIFGDLDFYVAESTKAMPLLHTWSLAIEEQYYLLFPLLAFAVYKYSKKLMPLVHLPVQSGSNKVLDLMNRKHTINEYYKIYDQLKKINSNIQFSSDFIIGYPGEDEDDFNDTFELIQKIKFINSYSFIFSPRPGTVAADLKLIDKKISMERLEKIQSQLYDNQMHMNKSLEDKTINVLVENLTDDATQVFGRSEYMTSVIFNGKKDDVGKIVPVKIIKSNRSTLFGERDFNSNQKVA